MNHRVQKKRRIGIIVFQMSWNTKQPIQSGACIPTWSPTTVVEGNEGLTAQHRSIHPVWKDM